MDDSNPENKSNESKSYSSKNNWWIRIAVIGFTLPVIAVVAIPAFNSFEEEVSKQSSMDSGKSRSSQVVTQVNGLPTAGAVRHCGEPIKVSNCKMVGYTSNCILESTAHIPVTELLSWEYDKDGIQVGNPLRIRGAINPGQKVRKTLQWQNWSDGALGEIVICSMDPSSPLVSSHSPKQECAYPQEKFLKTLSEYFERRENYQTLPNVTAEQRKLNTTIINMTKQMISKIEQCESKEEVLTLLDMTMKLQKKLVSLSQG